MDIDRRFGGIARLYGQEALAAFCDAHVSVIGIGGVGSWAVETLLRSGVGRLTLIDMDHVAESNINRQLPALENTLGMSKIQVMADRAAQINPRCSVSLVDDFLTLENLQQLITQQHDCVLDCIDNYRIKAALVQHCKRNKIRLVVTGGAGGKKDPGRIRRSDLARTEQDPLLAKTRRLLRQQYGFSRNLKRRFDVPAVWSDEPLKQPLDSHCSTLDSSLNCAGFGSSMAVTASFGMLGASLVLDYLSSPKS